MPETVPAYEEYQRQVDLITSGNSTVAQAADDLYSQLSEDERLWLLDGDMGFMDMLPDMVSGNYSITPYESGAIQRLGIPGVRFTDGPRGILIGRNCTVFPTSSARATTFNPDLEEEVGLAMGKEMRSHGGNYFGGVCVNVAPNPKWGRAQETYGEDPLVVGSMGAGLSRGISVNGIACAKHFALNTMETMRFQADVKCAENVLHECFLPHFRQCIEEGNAESIMSAYNSVNGEFCGDNIDLLNGVLRDTWGYEDVTVTSDWMFGTRDVPKSIRAGLDMELPLRAQRAKFLPAALRKGQVSWVDIDRMGKRIIRSQLKLSARIAGTPVPSPDKIPRCAEHIALARRVATQSMVLLKNDVAGKPILPLKSKKKLLVLGELADSKQSGDKGSSNVMGDTSVISPLEGLKAGGNFDITYLDGNDLEAVERAVEDADAIFCLVGYTGVEEGEYVNNFTPKALSTFFPYQFPNILFASAATWVIGKALSLYTTIAGKVPGGDRDNMRLIPMHERLVNAVVEFAGDKTVLAIEASGPVILPKAVRQNCAAILMTGYGGCEFGPALDDVLVGKAEPSGRLAYGIVESELDLPDVDMKATSVEYGRYWGYRMSQQTKKRPAYPFGFGLGYGAVEVSSESVTAPKSLSERFFDVQVMVKNASDVATSHVVQIYAGPAENKGQHTLVGFKRTGVLGKGEAVTVSVQCRLDPIAQWNKSNKSFEVKEGSYILRISKHEGDNQAIEVECQVDNVKWDVKTKLAQTPYEG